jgi:hypothetical protein
MAYTQFDQHANAAPHQRRVIDEKEALDVKIAALSKFLCSEISQVVSTDERDRLMRQSAAMTEYSSILGERIAEF